MIYLPDVNVWIALALARHVHQSAAKRWLDGAVDDEILFCRISELGLVRMLTNRHMMQNDVLSLAEAWRVYDSFRADSRVLFLFESIAFSERWRGARGQLTGGTNTITDAHLAVFAKHAGATVVTFDRGFKPIDGCDVMVLSQ